MLNFPPLTEADRRAAACIKHKRALEEERKKRIFNARQRVIGIDQETLQRQIEEKHKQQMEEKRQQMQYDMELIQRDKMAVDFDRKRQEERQRIEREINEYRKIFQRRDDRIDDAKPFEILTSDAANTGFMGEDPQREERLRSQREQVKSWLEQQMQENQSKKREQQRIEDAHMAAIIASDKKAVEMDRMDQQCKKRLQEALTRFNVALATQKRRETLQHEQQTVQANLAEMYNMYTSDMLTENPDVSKSSLNPNKRIGFLYKGMDADEKVAFRTLQMQQVEEMKMRREMEKNIEREFNEYLLGTERVAMQKDQEMEQKLRQLNKEIAETNRLLAEEQKDRVEFLRKNVYTNQLAPEFYEQFNKSTR